MSRNLPNNRLESFQDADHAVYQQKPEEFRKLVLEFCREHGIIKGDSGMQGPRPERTSARDKGIVGVNWSGRCKNSA